MRLEALVLVKGGGDLATGVAHRLFRSRFPVAITEIAQPTVVRRTVAFAEAVYAGRTLVEGIEAKLAGSASEVPTLLDRGILPVLVDPDGSCISQLRPFAVVDAVMAKRNSGTCLQDAPVVVAIGPGFTASVDCHAVVETNRGHSLGRVITMGQTEPDTGVPGSIDGHTARRILRSPAAGQVRAWHEIGDLVHEGDVVADVAGQPVVAQLDGVLRGLLHEGLEVVAGTKVGDVDPRANRHHCFTISDKSLAVGGGVLEALMNLWSAQPRRSAALQRLTLRR